MPLNERQTCDARTSPGDQSGGTEAIGISAIRWSTVIDR
jgi:hypothetical protein